MEPLIFARPIRLPSPGPSRWPVLAAFGGGLLSGPTTTLAPVRLTHPHDGRIAVKLQQSSLSL
jgi:hypothetical protein